MKNKIILILFISIVNLFAYDKLDMSTIQTKGNMKNYLYCMEDKNGTLDFEKILKSKNLKKFKKTNLGYSFSSFWCRSDITNKSNEKKDFVFYNPRPGVDIIDTKIYKKSHIISYTMGDMRVLENRELKSIFSNFFLTLEPNENVTIISKYSSIANIEIDWTIKDINTFFSYQNIAFTLIIFYIGFLSALAILKVFTYYYVKDKIYLIYALFVFAAIISNLSVTGMMHYYFSNYLDMFTITISSFIFSHIFLASLWLFTFYFFQVKKTDWYYYPIIIIIIFNSITILGYSYSYVDISIIAITPIILLISLIETLLLLLFSFIMLLKKKAGSKLFFSGHFLYVGSIIYYILNLSGTQSTPVNSMFISSLGIFFATLFMSLALSSRFKKLKDENDTMRLEHEKNKQYTRIGTSISYVTHQWKQPLSILSSQLMRIQAFIDNKPDRKITTIKNDIDKMQENIIFINKTLSSIKSLFKIDTTNESTFQILDVLKNLKTHFESYIISKEIKISIEGNSIQIKGNKNLFFHAIKNIIQNSIDAIIEKEIQNPTIKMIIHNEKYISIQDNAGGIDKKKLSTIFEQNQSTKKDGMGIGLNITKEILQKEFQMGITIQNTKDGTKSMIQRNKEK